MSVIEFQKRGLPHTHITITLEPEDKPVTPEQIDEIICAEIPDKDVDPIAYETVLRCMLHGPCGDAYPNAPCMVNGKCSKHYPKRFCEATTIDEDGFVSYRRRNDPSKRVTINGFTFDNRWVVPYHRDSVVRHDAHINVEKVARPKITKYLYKYMTKGCDRADVWIEDNVTIPHENGHRCYRNADEIKTYLDCRYVSSIEACWKIFEFDIQKQYPSVLRLQYHLPDHQFIVFNDNDHLYSVVHREDIHDTMLTRWFEVNRNHAAAKSLTYVEFPTRWVWNKGTKQWTPRQSHKCIGRLPYAHPNSGERYYLRMLLHKVRGAESFDDIKTVNGILHPTFKAACGALGLLDDDNEWHAALTEASTWATAKKLRNMYCTILMFSEVTNPLALWEFHWKSLTDDLQYQIQRDMRNPRMQIGDDELKNLGLFEIELILNKNGRSLKDFPPMPLPSIEVANLSVNRLIREELDYDCASEKRLFDELYSGLNDGQLKAFNAIMNAKSTKRGGFFFCIWKWRDRENLFVENINR